MSGPKVCQHWTLERIRDERCVEEGACWIWSGGMSGPGKDTPQMHWRGKVTPAYIVTWLLLKDRDSVPPGLSLWRGCRDKHCINPAHIKSGTKAEMRADLAAKGAYTCTPSRKARITATIRRTSSKIRGMDEAREIRASDLSEAALSARHGISVSRINRIRNGKAWCETVIPQASIFSMGGAA
jgi:hypothetical protein